MSRPAPVAVMGDSNVGDSNATPVNGDEVSLFRIGSTLLRNRRRIARWMVVGGVLALVPVLFQKYTYTATASFVPQGAADPSRSGVASLAGQLGIQVGSGGNLAQSPDFYVTLLRSRAILAPIAADSFVVTEKGKGRTALLDLMGVQSPSPNRRLELGVTALSHTLDTKIELKTGVVTVAVTTQWPTLSRAIAARLMDGVNTFNLRTRQSQASEERRFTEGRLGEARGALRGAEDRLQSFLQRNRQIQNSPDLIFDRDRLQRDVSLQQNIVTSLAQSYEEVRIREVRDTPVITVIEEPSLPTQPNPRGRVRRALAGMLAAGFIAAFVAFTSDMVRRRRAVNDPEAVTFLELLAEIKAGFARLMPKRRRKAHA
jgi:uncharacterized protein involved in exopolysaccharide biosynthesis